MNTVGIAGVAIVGILCVVGCSSSEDSSAKRVSEKTNAARARFTSGPSATLTNGNGSRVLSETKRQQSSGAGAMKGNPIGGGSGSSSTKSLATRSLHILGGDEQPIAEAGGSEPVASTCPDIVAEKNTGTCACPGGGKLAYEVPNLKALKSGSLPEEIDIAFTYEACVMDGKKYEGALGMLMSKKSVVNADSKESSASSSSASAGGMNMLIVANELSVGGEKLDFAFAMDGGKFYYAPSVDDKGGYVLTELSLTGETKVHAKNGAFDCKVEADGAGDCKNDKSGETIQLGGAK